MQAVDAIVGTPASNVFAANTPVTQQLDRDGMYDEIRIRMSGTLTLASYSVAPTKAATPEHNLIGLVQVSATGAVQDVFKSCGFDWFVDQMQLLEGTAPEGSTIGTSNQAYDFQTVGAIYFRGAGNWHTPMDTLLESRLLSGLSVTLNWRDVTAMITGGTGGTATLSNVAATLLARKWVGVDATGHPAFGHLRESEIITNVAASQNDFAVNQIPVGNLIRRMAFKGTVGATAYSDPSDALFDTTRPANLHLKDGSFYPLSVGYNDLRARNKAQFKLESLPTGLAVWEPSIHGTMFEQYDARRKQQLTALVDVDFTGSNTNTLAIRTVEHVLPAAK